MHVDSHTFGLLWMTKAKRSPPGPGGTEPPGREVLDQNAWAVGREVSSTGLGFGVWGLFVACVDKKRGRRSPSLFNCDLSVSLRYLPADRQKQKW